MNRHQRSFELRMDPEGDGRTLIGTAVPYDSPAQISDWRGDYTEVFKPGSLAKTIDERGKKIRIHYQHMDRMLPVGVATQIYETRDGATVHARISETAMGNDILALARDGALNAFSVQFTPVGERWVRPDFREITEAKLHEISIVNEPAYSGALVTAIRSVDQPDPEQVEAEEAETDEAPLVPAALYAARARLWALRYNV